MAIEFGLYAASMPESNNTQVMILVFILFSLPDCLIQN